MRHLLARTLALFCLSGTLAACVAPEGDEESVEVTEAGIQLDWKTVQETHPLMDSLRGNPSRRFDCRSRCAYPYFARVGQELEIQVSGPRMSEVVVVSPGGEVLQTIHASTGRLTYKALQTGYFHVVLRPDYVSSWELAPSQPPILYTLSLSRLKTPNPVAAPSALLGQYKSGSNYANYGSDGTALLLYSRPSSSYYWSRFEARYAVYENASAKAWDVVVERSTPPNTTMNDSQVVNYVSRPTALLSPELVPRQIPFGASSLSGGASRVSQTICQSGKDCGPGSTWGGTCILATGAQTVLDSGSYPIGQCQPTVVPTSPAWMSLLPPAAAIAGYATVQTIGSSNGGLQFVSTLHRCRGTNNWVLSFSDWVRGYSGQVPINADGSFSKADYDPWARENNWEIEGQILSKKVEVTFFSQAHYPSVETKPNVISHARLDISAATPPSGFSFFCH